jgi:hypothetical protein
MSSPTIFSWPLISGYAPGSSIPSTSELAPGAGISTCTPEYFTEEDLLEILSGLLPAWYLEPLQSPGPGYEMFQAYAAMLSRVSESIGHFECSNYVMTSHGGARATGTVELYRASATAGAFTQKRGTLVRTSKTNRTYRLIEDVEFGAADLFVSCEVESLGFGGEYNVPGPTGAADESPLPGEIDLVVLPLQVPIFAEPTIQVRQVSDMTGGQAAVLDTLGGDRNLPRLPGETDEVYKGRIRSLPDTVSPDAIRRQLDAVFLPLGFSYDFIETWENRYNTCWNQPDAGEHAVFGELTQLAYNDSRTDRFIPRWMSERDHRGAFAIIMPDFPAVADRGMAYNDDATEGSTSRGVSAWSSSTTTLLTGALDGVYNGTDDDQTEGLAALLENIWDLIRRCRGAGIAVAFFPREALQELP